MVSLLQDVIVQLRLFNDAAVHVQAVGNRRVYQFTLGQYEYTLTRRDTYEPDGFERTEILRLLTTLRAAERVQNWTCPEPTENEIQGAARRMLPPRRP